MSKSAGPPSYGPPPAAPPSYSQAMGGVPPSSPYTPQQPGSYQNPYPCGFSAHPGAPPPPGMQYPAAAVMMTDSSAGYMTVQPGPVVVTTVVPVGKEPTHMVCPHCHAEIDTSTKTEPGLIAYLSGFVLCLLGCWAGCCLIPCCINDCMDVHHTCPNCKAYLGRYRR